MQERRQASQLAGELASKEHMSAHRPSTRYMQDQLPAVRAPTKGVEPASRHERLVAPSDCRAAPRQRVERARR
eukprot:2868525-Alexandrium_andersonii.AAC.1